MKAIELAKLLLDHPDVDLTIIQSEDGFVADLSPLRKAHLVPTDTVMENFKAFVTDLSKPETDAPVGPAPAETPVAAPEPKTSPGQDVFVTQPENEGIAFNAFARKGQIIPQVIRDTFSLATPVRGVRMGRSRVRFNQAVNNAGDLLIGVLQPFDRVHHICTKCYAKITVPQDVKVYIGDPENPTCDMPITCLHCRLTVSIEHGEVIHSL